MPASAISRVVAPLVLSIAVLTCAVHAADPAVSDWGTVEALQSGWVVDRMLVFHNASLKNPDNCSITTNGYIINETDPARQTFYAMLISAFIARKQVAFVVSGCFDQRPRIVSVSIR
jgi:hypothetical protein